MIDLYDRTAAVSYAHKWAYNRNAAYYDFDGMGGDCTNFVSQVLFAGGAQPNYAFNGWYFNSLGDRSPAWSGVNELYAFLVSRHTHGPKAAVVTASDIMLGDIIQFGMANGSFYHSVIVVDTHNLLVAAHTIDSDYRPLASYNYELIRFLHVI